jgi:imidazole glycerol phosphate synthase glutamine amidotransferase subunit
MIAVLDSGFGNLHSALNALHRIGAQAELVADPDALVKADRILFPGVGSWGAVMQRLDEKGFTEAIKDVIAAGKSYLGICMGLQVLLETSEEDEGRGLSVYEGSVVKFRTKKVPQIGWNRVESKSAEAVPADYFYFINSFHVRPRDETLIAATATYMNEDFVAALRRDNVLAVQFHPEKSARAGLDLLRRWVQS